MILLDENISEQQRQQLQSWGIPVRHIGFTRVAQPGLTVWHLHSEKETGYTWHD